VGRKEGERRAWSVYVWWGVHGREDSANPRTSGMRKRTPSMGKIVEVAPTDFPTLQSRDMFCTHSFMLTSSVGLEQYQFENLISSDNDY
jgi:hypothetical protein